MKKNNSFLYILLIGAILLVASCKKFAPEVLPMTPIEIGVADSYESLDENTTLSIPVKFTAPGDSAIASAVYKVVNKRATNNASVVTLVQSPAVPIAFDGKAVNTTINVPVRTGLMSVVIIITDKAGRMSSKSINVKNVSPSKANVKTLTDVVMSTDPADNKNFLSIYEQTPVFGRADAITKQSRVDFILVNMSGARLISTNAYGAGTTYYDASKVALAGFTTLTYGFLSSNRAVVNRANFSKINTDEDLTKFMNDSIIAIPSSGGINYNIINADRRVSDVWGVSSAERGLLIGWGYRSHPTASAVILNEAFGLIIVKSVTQKTNGHYIATLDIKAHSKDQRADYSATPIAPYPPYPL